MTTSLSSRRLKRLMAALACGAALALSCGASPAAPELLKVKIDQARIAHLPEHAATIVVGNPLIADVSLQQGGLMVLTGKGYGLTNVIALDRNGAVLTEYTVEVQGPSEGVVVVYRGMDRESYSCTPRCERRITLGDSETYFDQTLQQTGTRNLRAQGASGGGAGAAGVR